MKPLRLYIRVPKSRQSNVNFKLSFKWDITEKQAGEIIAYIGALTQKEKDNG